MTEPKKGVDSNKSIIHTKTEEKKPAHEIVKQANRQANGNSHKRPIMSGKQIDVVRIKKEPGQDEADTSSNSASSNGAEPTRQSSLQRIQLRKERVCAIIFTASPTCD